MAAAARGAWTAKIARQSNASVRTPPNAGPTAVPNVPAATQRAIARARSPLRATSNGSDAPRRNAAPIPWATLPPTSTPRLSEAAHTIEDTKKTPSPASASQAGRTRRKRQQREGADDDREVVRGDDPGDLRNGRLQLEEELGQREDDDRGVRERDRDRDDERDLER